jgi:3-(3-hydroxy-phenyl)propionate hydroxylase
MTWIPDARYDEGYFAGGHPAVGWQIPQPWVADGAGGTMRLDDLLGGQWAILHTGASPSGAHPWTAMGVPTVHISEPTLIRWLRRKKASAVVVRPDGFIYAASQSGQPLPAPPSIPLLTCAPAIMPIRTGVPA